MRRAHIIYGRRKQRRKRQLARLILIHGMQQGMRWIRGNRSKNT
jgi:hypothetical protein